MFLANLLTGTHEGILNTVLVALKRHPYSLKYDFEGPGKIRRAVESIRKNAVLNKTA